MQNTSSDHSRSETSMCDSSCNSVRSNVEEEAVVAAVVKDEKKRIYTKVNTITHTFSYYY